MVVVSAPRARAILGTRLVLLSLGVLVMVVPFAYMISTSFKNNTLVLEIPPQFIPHHPTTANYSQAWTSNRFGRYFLNSLAVAAATTVLSVWLSSMMAYAFARFRFPGKRLLFGLLLDRVDGADDDADHPAVPARKEPRDARFPHWPCLLLHRRDSRA